MGLSIQAAMAGAAPEDDDPLTAEFFATGYFPPQLPRQIAVKGHGRPFPLDPEDTFALVTARGRLCRWLASQVTGPAYQALNIAAKRAFLRDEFNRTDQEAIAALYSNPRFRARLNSLKGA